jgi:hypothetical protein
MFGWLTGADNARDAANQGLYQGAAAFQGKYADARNVLRQQYGKALDPYQDLWKQAGRGAGMYGDALGLGGAAGQQKAYDAFMRTPGMQAGFDMGAQAIDRGAASRGMLGSGNTNIDLQKFATDYGSRNFSNYMSQLSPYLNQQGQAAAGMGSIHTGLGNALAGNMQGVGNMLYGTHAGAGQNNAGAAMAGAPMNFLGLGLNLGTKLLGMM